MTRAGGGDTATRRDLLGSPGWQEKLKHYLLNHVRVETNICWPSVQPSDPLELLAPPPRDVSIMSSQPSRCYLALSPPLWAGPGRGGKAPRCRDSTAELIPDMQPQRLLLNSQHLVFGAALSSEASFLFREVQWEPHILPHLLPGALVLTPTNGVSLGKSFPSAGSQFPY